MSISRWDFDVVRSEILSAIAELRVVAKTENDEARGRASDWLEKLFEAVSDRQGLRQASRRALGLYRGGMGSFQDVGSAALSKAVSRLRAALRRGNSRFLRRGR